jgi:hypothetical protein
MKGIPVFHCESRVCGAGYCSAYGQAMLCIYVRDLFKLCSKPTNKRGLWPESFEGISM